MFLKINAFFFEIFCYLTILASWLDVAPLLLISAKGTHMSYLGNPGKIKTLN